jgi:hypothetical protein
MANNNTRFGFRPIIRDGGGPFSVTQYWKPATDPNAIFHFDIVQKVAASVPMDEALYSAPAIASAYPTGVPATTLWLGASIGYGLPSTISKHSVSDETDCVFLVKVRTGVLVTTAAHAGKNANLFLGTGSPIGGAGRSGHAINGTTIAADPSLDCRIRSVAMTPPNTEGDSAIVEVTINKHFYAQGTAGV